MKKTNKKGFTLAELLIVVAIIAVLVAIAIPIFTSQLEKSKEATDLSNVRAAYAEAVAAYISEGETGTYTVDLTSDVSNVKSTGNVAGVDVSNILNNATCTIVVASDGSVTINGQAATKTIGTKS
ncbi:MAG: prepilin-type N-terminal cleavage/methylation domain-containing protein [Clostridia bacterium]|nr:prepilin-type N-terminal cleavage/methylation domain-containing protein [Clostridia bacterium]MBR5747042.1 prepilin-type N-terminal cleavage/methylation domain-containing protein [Clostridia bacterium]